MKRYKLISRRKGAYALFLILCAFQMAACKPALKAEKEASYDAAEKEERDTDFSAPDIIGVGYEVNEYMERFQELCRFRGTFYDEEHFRAGMKIETRQFSRGKKQKGMITRFEDYQGKVYKYRLIFPDGFNQTESNYYFLDDFIYYTVYTDVAKEYEILHTSIPGRDSRDFNILEGVITGGKCFRYDRVHDLLLEEEISLAYDPEELLELYHNGKKTGAKLTAEYEDQEQAMKVYKEFLASDGMYRITATDRYPRGDSTAVYAFGDCTGDGIMELHIDGGSRYWIYTLRGGELFLLQSFEHNSYYPAIIPLKDGSFVGSGRKGKDPVEGEYMTTYKRIPTEASVFTEKEQWPGYSDFYFYFRLNGDGLIMDSLSHEFSVEFHEAFEKKENLYVADRIECTKDQWENKAAPYLRMLQEDSLHLTWNRVFPEEEWEYLDGANGWYGTDEAGDDSQEWKVYERILKGDFSLIESIDDRSRLYSKYESSLDEDTGRSEWKYILMDLNGDGVQELFVRYYPDMDSGMTLDSFVHANYLGISCFSYKNGEVSWWDSDSKETRYVPLKDGRVLQLYYQSFTLYGMLGVFDSKFDFQPQGKIYEQLTVVERDDFYNREWFETYIFSNFPVSSKEEGEYYFIEDYDEDVYTKPKSISNEEWYQWRGMVDELLIPEYEWEPAAFFSPSPNVEGFYIG